ncbi:MAG TPA: RidA family protein [Candidatus Fournierella merdipullorum]|uniref:RidA family protein n=1 Tax=Candidatus Allofournierella merdipullorum TaxID=2838595 RepID=A0A9D2E606_9FIRM|nr:RidA family protein [Candidatus Fournierella merdipullorum]
MKCVQTKHAPAAIGPYSQALVTGGLVFTSGQIPLDPATGAVVEGGVEAQAEQVMKNLAAVLEEAGSGLDKAVKTTCFLADMNDFAAFNEVYARYFTGKPARSCVAVRQLPKSVLVEVEVIAELG